MLISRPLDAIVDILNMLEKAENIVIQSFVRGIYNFYNHLRTN